MGGAGPDPPLPRRVALIEALLNTLQGADQLAALSVVDRAMRLGWSVDDVRFELITPALHEVGLRWERGQIGVGEEHLATSICEWLLFTLAGRVRRPPGTGGRALVGCSENELHSLGARVVAHVLAEQGWKVLFLGAATPTSTWPEIVRSRRPDIAVLTTTTRAALDAVGPAVRAIKTSRPECRTVVGGQAYWEVETEAADVGADLLALEARTLAMRLTEAA